MLPTDTVYGPCAEPGTEAPVREIHRLKERPADQPVALLAKDVDVLLQLVPELRSADILPGPVGIRAQALNRDGSLVDDFVVHRTERAVHVRNAPSPAATSSLPLARLIADEAEALL